MRISGVNNVSFASQKLTAMARQELLKPADYDWILEENPEEDRYLGEVPFGNPERVQEIFSNFAQNVYTPILFKPKNFAENMACLEQDLSKELNKDVKVKYLSRGAFGKVFKLSADKKKYVVKVFHSDNADGYTTHGKGAEVLNATYAGANVPDKFAKFYFGKFARKEDNDGFILSEYLTGEKKAPQLSVPDLDEDEIKATEFAYIIDTNDENYRKGKIIDYGSLKLHKAMRDPKIQTMTREILRAFKSADSIPDAVRTLKENYRKELKNTISALTSSHDTDYRLLKILEILSEDKQ